MIGVNHVDVVQICGGAFVGHVYGVAQGKIPDREGLKLCVSCLDAALVLLIELAQAYGHLAAAGAGGRHNHKGLGGFNVIVLAKAFI